MLTAREPTDRATERRIYWTAFALRCGLGVAAWFLASIVKVPFLEDATQYEIIGSAIADDWLAGQQSLWLQSAIDGGTQAWVLPAIIGAFYFALGGLRAVPVLIASYAALTSYTPVITYRLTKRFGGGQRAASFAGYLVALSPGFVFWSGSLYKEGLIYFVINSAVWSVLVLIDRWRTGSFLVLTGALGLFFGLRFYIALLLTIFAAGSLLLGRGKSTAVGAWIPILLRQLAVAGIIGLVLTLAGVTGRMRTVIPSDWLSMTRAIQVSRSDLARANSGYLPDADVSTPAKALAFVPKGAAYFLSVPLPWQVGEIRQNLTIPETLLWILMYPLAFLGCLKTWRTHRRFTIVVVGFTFAVCFFYAVFIGNIGTAYRLRLQVWLLWAIFIGIGWEAWRGPSKGARSAHAGTVLAE